MVWKIGMITLMFGLASVAWADDSGEPPIGKRNRTVAAIKPLGRPQPKLAHGGEVLHPKIPKSV